MPRHRGAMRQRRLGSMIALTLLVFTACGDNTDSTSGDDPDSTSGFEYSTVPVFGEDHTWQPAHEPPADVVETITADVSYADRAMILPTTPAPIADPAAAESSFDWTTGSLRPGYGMVQHPGVTLTISGADGTTLVEVINHPRGTLTVCPSSWTEIMIRSAPGCHDSGDVVRLRWEEGGYGFSADFAATFSLDTAIEWLDDWMLVA
jgi:hypothetical protein